MTANLTTSGLRETLARLEKLLTDNSPTILTAIGVAGSVTTAYLTGRATFKAAEVIRKQEYYGEVLDLPVKEKIQLVWKLYLPAMGSAVLTVTAIIFANRIGTRRAAAMAAAYSLSERALTEYRDKVVEKLGEKKEQEVRDELAQDRVTKNPVGSREVIIAGGSVLCFEVLTGRYFTSDIETLRRAQNDVNQRILHEGYASLNDFYELIGLPFTSISEELGWTSDANGMLSLEISAVLSDDNRPCLSVDYKTNPGRNYFKHHR